MEKEGDDMIYFTSDLHLGHHGIIGMQNQSFKNVEEMNHILIGNYNSVVHKNDTVYILGDISHHMPIEQVNELIGKMNGKKILIKEITTKDICWSYLKRFVILRRFR